MAKSLHQHVSHSYLVYTKQTIAAVSRPILEEKTPDSASEMLKEWEKKRQEAIHVISHIFI